jgi:uncharacterized membrane protein YgdD (TMEM256/DUF423 family)
MTNFVRGTVVAAALFGATGVVAGAFGAHALRESLPPERLAVFETASRYQLLHALALLGAAWVVQQWPGRWSRAGAWMLGAGIALFSGSLYLLAGTGERALGAITPLGGGLLILGWLSIAMAPLRAPR